MNTYSKGDAARRNTKVAPDIHGVFLDIKMTKATITSRAPSHE
ncbi:hypothetical protein QWY82_07245 [Simiduia curdlanivorans]|uniref:Uncharacterized protein n=1 Tax=Simiduia curdlanivorans TaxID=1492769 RepID=A0ABV8V7Q3_9GAMM|nr:hypothetical protein [Simiduia curdlanivorans]MDN3638596.1 hypothetical protein [Simiduia curdlanivorans]